VSDLHDAQRFIGQLREAAARVPDDSLGSPRCLLKHLEVDMLKIDGQFIRELASDAATRCSCGRSSTCPRLRKIRCGVRRGRASLEMLRPRVDCAQATSWSGHWRHPDARCGADT